MASPDTKKPLSALSPPSKKGAFYDFLPIVQPIGLLLGIIGFYRALSNGIDIFEALFRGVIVYGGFVLVAVGFYFVYMMMLKNLRQREAMRLAEERYKAQMEAVKAEEEKRKQREQAQT